MLMLKSLIYMKKFYDLSNVLVKIWKLLFGGDYNLSVIEEGYFEVIVEFINRVVRERREKDEKDEF